MSRQASQFRAPPVSKVVSIDSGGHRRRVTARRDALIEAHPGLVLELARRVARSLALHFDFDDLVGAGNVALCAAATQYSPERHGVALFACYARKAVRGAIIECVRRKQYRENVRPGIEDLQQLVGESPSVEVSIDTGRLWKRIRAAVATLPEDQREVLTGYYGPDSPSMAVVGQKLGLKPMQAYYLRDLAIDGLRASLLAEAV